MTDVMFANSPTYPLSVSTSSASCTVTAAAQTEFVNVFNPNTSHSLAFCTGDSGVSATFPTSSTVQNVTVVGPGKAYSMRKPKAHTHVAAVYESGASTTTAFVQWGTNP